MKILVCTLADEPYWPLARISVPNKAAYAARHGYDFAYCTESWWTQFPTSWSKIFWLRNLLEQSGADWIFWTDIDSLIMDQSFKLESLLEDDKPLVIHSNQDGINTGQFIISNELWSDNIMDAAFAIRQGFKDHPWFEQAALQTILKNHEDKIKVVDGSFNRMVASGPEHGYKEMLDKFYDVWKPDDFCLHFAGVGGERAPVRQQLMEYFSTLVQP